MHFAIRLFLCPAQAGHSAERPSEAEFIPRFQQMTVLKLTHIASAPQSLPNHIPKKNHFSA